MADELKPCPFCGGDAVLRDGECGIRGMPMTWRNPQCTRCGCDLGYCHHLEAVERWNRRALSHAAGQDGEQCRAASVDSGRLASKLEDVRDGIADVLPIVYLETIDDAIEALRALSRGVPEGK